ncbi:MAG: hypothetical protein J5J00_04050 [Deltaproteobacteria bacterium]|nr:hypothetical protein [Deltaproteobacteria bacterium]
MAILPASRPNMPEENDPLGFPRLADHNFDPNLAEHDLGSSRHHNFRILPFPAGKNEHYPTSHELSEFISKHQLFSGASIREIAEKAAPPSDDIEREVVFNRRKIDESDLRRLDLILSGNVGSRLNERRHEFAGNILLRAANLASGKDLYDSSVDLLSINGSERSQHAPHIHGRSMRALLHLMTTKGDRLEHQAVQEIFELANHSYSRKLFPVAPDPLHKLERGSEVDIVSMASLSSGAEEVARMLLSAPEFKAEAPASTRSRRLAALSSLSSLPADQYWKEVESLRKLDPNAPWQASSCGLYPDSLDLRRALQIALPLAGLTGMQIHVSQDESFGVGGCWAVYFTPNR